MGVDNSENSYSGQSVQQLIEAEILDALNSERGGYLDRFMRKLWKRDRPNKTS
jgi:hypothetical protein